MSAYTIIFGISYLLDYVMCKKKAPRSYRGAELTFFQIVRLESGL